jgi:hypothetical protein
MASAHPFNCVMHCSAIEYHKVNALGLRLISSGIYVNAALFPAPPVALAGATGFQAAVSKLTNLIASAKGNSNNTDLRDAQSELVHGMLEMLLGYANPICKHEIANIQLSGFDSSNVPQPTVKPLAPVIKKITEDKQEAGYYKATLDKPKTGGGALTDKVAALHHKSTRWTVKSSLVIAGPYTIQLEGAASTKLVFTGLTVGQKNYIIIYGVNNKGKGPDSKPYPFTPQIP